MSLSKLSGVAVESWSWRRQYSARAALIPLARRTREMRVLAESAAGVGAAASLAGVGVLAGVELAAGFVGVVLSVGCCAVTIGGSASAPQRINQRFIERCRCGLSRLLVGRA